MAEKKKRKAGRNKTRAKQKRYKEHCYSMRVAGYITDSNGVWTQNWKAHLDSEAQFKATTGR